MVSFSQLPAVKNPPFLVQLKQIFGPSYFVTDLATEILSQGQILACIFIRPDVWQTFWIMLCRILVKFQKMKPVLSSFKKIY